MEAASAMEVWTRFFGKQGMGRILAGSVMASSYWCWREKSRPVLQDWPFAVIPAGSGAGGYWLIQDPVLQHCGPGVGHSTLSPPGSSICAMQHRQG